MSRSVLLCQDCNANRQFKKAKFTHNIPERPGYDMIRPVEDMSSFVKRQHSSQSLNNNKIYGPVSAHLRITNRREIAQSSGNIHMPKNKNDTSVINSTNMQVLFQNFSDNLTRAPDNNPNSASEQYSRTEMKGLIIKGKLSNEILEHSNMSYIMANISVNLKNQTSHQRDKSVELYTAETKQVNIKHSLLKNSEDTYENFGEDMNTLAIENDTMPLSERKTTRISLDSHSYNTTKIPLVNSDALAAKKKHLHNDLINAAENKVSHNFKNLKLSKPESNIINMESLTLEKVHPDYIADYFKNDTNLAYRIPLTKHTEQVNITYDFSKKPKTAKSSSGSVPSYINTGTGHIAKTNEHRLVDWLFDGYNKHIRPTSEGKKITFVEFKLAFLNILQMVSHFFRAFFHSYSQTNIEVYHY